MADGQAAEFAADPLEDGGPREAVTEGDRPDTAPEPDARPDAAATEAMFAAMGELEPAQAAELRQRWGAEAAANLRHAAAAARAFDSPALSAFLEDSGLGDHPALIEAAARIGRRLAGDEPARASGRGAADGAAGQRQDGALDRQIEELTAQIHDAAQRGDPRQVDRLSRRRDGLAERLWGGQAIIGRDQRSL